MNSGSYKQSVNEFKEVWKDNPIYRKYIRIAELVEKDQAASELLQQLVIYQRDPRAIEIDSITFEQELARCQLLTDYLEIEKEMLAEYNKVWHQIFKQDHGCLGKTKSCAQGCEKCKRNL